MSACHADIVKPSKIAGLLNIGEAGDSTDKLKFYWWHNKTMRLTGHLCSRLLFLLKIFRHKPQRKFQNVQVISIRNRRHVRRFFFVNMFFALLILYPVLFAA
jgi:hypothetical protein